MVILKVIFQGLQVSVPVSCLLGMRDYSLAQQKLFSLAGANFVLRGELLSVTCLGCCMTVALCIYKSLVQHSACCTVVAVLAVLHSCGIVSH